MIKKIYIFVVSVLFLGAMNLPVLAQTQKPSLVKPSVSAPSVKSTPAKKPSVKNKTGSITNKYQKPVTPPVKTKISTQSPKPNQQKPSGK